MNKNHVQFPPTDPSSSSSARQHLKPACPRPRSSLLASLQQVNTACIAQRWTTSLDHLQTLALPSAVPVSVKYRQQLYSAQRAPARIKHKVQVHWKLLISISSSIWHFITSLNAHKGARKRGFWELRKGRTNVSICGPATHIRGTSKHPLFQLDPHSQCTPPPQLLTPSLRLIVLKVRS